MIIADFLSLVRHKNVGHTTWHADQMHSFFPRELHQLKRDVTYWSICHQDNRPSPTRHLKQQTGMEGFFTHCFLLRISLTVPHKRIPGTDEKLSGLTGFDLFCIAYLLEEMVSEPPQHNKVSNSTCVAAREKRVRVHTAR